MNNNPYIHPIDRSSYDRYHSQNQNITSSSIPSVPPPLIPYSPPTTVRNNNMNSVPQGPSSQVAPSAVQNVEQEAKSQDVSRKITIQICKHNNQRGSFNTYIYTPPTGIFPTLHSLKTKVDQLASTIGVEQYDLCFRYGLNKPKNLLTEDTFDDIDWNSDLLSLNITELNTKKRGKQTSDDNSAPPKKRTKYDSDNKAKADAEAKLRIDLPEDLRQQMSHADFIHAACLMAGNAQLWTIEKIEEYIRSKKTTNKKNGEKDATGSKDISSCVDATLSLQTTVIKLQEKMMNMETLVQNIQRHLNLE